MAPFEMSWENKSWRRLKIENNMDDLLDGKSESATLRECGVGCRRFLSESAYHTISLPIEQTNQSCRVFHHISAQTVCHPAADRYCEISTTLACLRMNHGVGKLTCLLSGAFHIQKNLPLSPAFGPLHMHSVTQ